MPRILAVDDRRANLVALQLVLEHEGYEVVVETSGRNVPTLCAGASFDLVLLDVMMPDMNGVEVAARLRGNPETTELPIVFVTAAEDLVAGVSIGGSPIEVIPKPIDLDVLRATAARLTARRLPPKVGKVSAR